MEDIKILLGARAANYSDAQILLCYKMAKAEIENYCNRTLDTELEMCATKIAIIMLNRLGSEGLTSESYSGISQNYINDYPEDIVKVLNRKRKIKVL